MGASDFGRERGAHGQGEQVPAAEGEVELDRVVLAPELVALRADEPAPLVHLPSRGKKREGERQTRNPPRKGKASLTQGKGKGRGKGKPGQGKGRGKGSLAECRVSVNPTQVGRETFASPFSNMFLMYICCLRVYFKMISVVVFFLFSRNCYSKMCGW